MTIPVFSKVSPSIRIVSPEPFRLEGRVSTQNAQNINIMRIIFLLNQFLYRTLKSWLFFTLLIFFSLIIVDFDTFYTCYNHKITQMLSYLSCKCMTQYFYLMLSICMAVVQVIWSACITGIMLKCVVLYPSLYMYTKDFGNNSLISEEFNSGHKAHT